MENKNVRQVKVCGKYHHRSGHGRNLPWVTVSGLWLENAGFKIGDQLQISFENNKLIIPNQQHDIKTIKEQLAIETVVEHYGLTTDRQHRLLCPFHQDKTRSLQEYP